MNQLVILNTAEQEENPLFIDNDSDTESTFASVPDHIDSPPRRSTGNRNERFLYPDQIAYGSGPFLEVNAKHLELASQAVPQTL